jgi:hypothetical protein
MIFLKITCIADGSVVFTTATLLLAQAEALKKALEDSGLYTVSLHRASGHEYVKPSKKADADADKAAEASIVAVMKEKK